MRASRWFFQASRTLSRMDWRFRSIHLLSSVNDRNNPEQTSFRISCTMGTEIQTTELHLSTEEFLDFCWNTYEVLRPLRIPEKEREPDAFTVPPRFPSVL